MEAGQPDSKRPRLMSWSSSSGPQPPSLLHSHASKQLPPPQPHPSGPHGHPAPYPPPFPPRHSDHSAPPTPAASHGLGLQHPDADRRRHEQDALAPMHDYRQQPAQQQPPPHSPVHPPFAGYPGRDVSIKRESLEDARRSNSIGGHGPESAHPQHHPLAPSHHSQGPQPPPPPHIAPSYSDNQRHMGYDNPSSVPPTPGGYRHYPPPPTPMSHTQPSYEPQPAYQSTPTASAPPEPIYSVYSSSAANPMKKKNTRASQACDQCRQLKAKCDETKPCKTCRDKGTECRYRDPIPKATDKAHTDILDGLSLMQNGMASLSEHFKRLEERMVNMQSFITGKQVEKGKDFFVPRVSTQKNGEESVLKLDLTGKPDQAASNSTGTGEQGSGDLMTTPGEAHPLRMMDEDEMEAEPGPPVAPGEPAIPMNHTTLAGLLLEWSSIRELTKHHLDRQGVRFISEYPISTEQSRGLLIPYGRGEDVHPSRQPREQHDHGSLDASEDSSDMASPSPAADWGHVGGMSPSEHIEYRGGALTPEGGPDFSEAKVWSYVESFKENILNMHPVIQPPILDDWIRHFLNSMPSSNSRSTPKPQTVKSAFAVGGNTPPVGDAAALKRKRSPEPDNEEGYAASSGTKFRPSRTIHTALILTILALGKVCLHRESVPDALQNAESLPRGSPMSRNGTLSSPSQGSPPNFLSRSQSTGLPSPRDNGEPVGFHSRRSSFHGATAVRSGYGLQKNYDVIPGLEYFAYATDILGNHLGSYNNMKNVYTNIFAGLYQGQLGRPLESFAFIHQASHKLQVIMRPSLDKLRKFRQSGVLASEPKYNQLALAFWTCLQLESDLIAELPLPPSGLLSYENDMPHPNMSLLRGFPQNVLDSYPGQLYLRTHLNSIHRMFYSPEDPSRGSRGEEKFQNVQLVVDSVKDMRWAAPSFAFKESDPPAGDILAARLRAKYWGAQVITYRPFIRQLLQFSHNRKHPLSPNPPATSEFRSDIDVPRIAPQAKSSSEIDTKIIDYAEKGIKALIESTRAFHGLGEDRPIITNVFGTAHAQWGNLLVLSAAAKDPILKKFVDMQLLEHLFQRTIRFLRQSATSTSSLKIDMHILEGLWKDLFGTSAQSSAHLQTPQLPMAAPNAVPQATENGDHAQNGHRDESSTPI